jgi:hypothetical protein
VVADEGLEVLSGFGSMVYDKAIRQDFLKMERARTEGHLGEEVVDYMVVRDVMEKETSLPAQKRPVYRGCGAALEVPLLATVMGECRVSVVQVGNHDDCS